MTFDSIIRIIDVNLNRAGEGLRVLEEIARFVLNDAGLSQRLKDGNLDFNQALLQARDAAGDVGAALTAPGQREEKNLSDLAVANARRVQEALRVLEEMAKLKDLPRALDSDRFERGRFAVYAIEQEIVFKLIRRDKLRFIRGLYAIVDTETLKGRSHADITRQLLSGGARIIQLRDKVSSKQVLYPLAMALKQTCTEAGALFIMNDYLDLALAVKADGLHIGQTDLPLVAARRLLPAGMLLGLSTQSVPQAIQAEKDGADYIGVGAVFSTNTKKDARPHGLGILAESKKAVKLPIVAIGGITLENLPEVIAAGADAAAVISALLNAPSPEAAARQFVRQFNTN
jgi:thiamine-phosphate pyrophosphorylase